MAKLSMALASTQRALKTLDEIIQQSYTIIVRDAAIQRFEYTFEAVWKLLKVYLKIQEGIVCNSPKRCFRQALQIEILTAEQVAICLMMTDDRNLISHTYVEEIAEVIYHKLPTYYAVMQTVLLEIQSQLTALASS